MLSSISGIDNIVPRSGNYLNILELRERERERECVCVCVCVQGVGKKEEESRGRREGRDFSYW